MNSTFTINTQTGVVVDINDLSVLRSALKDITTVSDSHYTLKY